MWKRFVTILGFVCAFHSIPLPADDKSAKTVWDGVYTASQANRGQSIYDRSCMQCHGEDLTKSGNVLQGAKFLNEWREDSLKSLFATIKISMPRNAPQSLSDAAYVDIVAYLLQANSFPASGNELTLDALEHIRIVGKEGPQSVPNFSLVSVSGCLTQISKETWTLKSATEPARTRNPKESTDAELAGAAARPAGTHTFRLLDMLKFPKAAQPGHWMEAKGLLIRAPGDDRLNLTWLGTLSDDCKQPQ
jgi:S-disulfanyl-L-cysteine oxidoreductase SoxD